MADVYAEFDDKQVREFIKRLRKKLEGVKDGDKKYMGLLSAIVFADVMDHFKKQQGPDGNWKPWSKIYKEHAEKEGKIESANMLKWTGYLRNNFKPTDWRIEKEGPLWFNNAVTKSGFPYAFAHDNDKEPRTRLPRRSFMWLSDQALDKIEVQTLAFMLEEGV